ncbi:unnamed protein product [Rodentolepis nana]|uniref:Lysosome-associated membrane glycoprotein 3 n=1 Tax=Rodentolepis nana TaxID=102285 RepID=A0A0R3T0W9_RODNA|nr:unnamed protein product [Rodentolepis nana]
MSLRLSVLVLIAFAFAIVISSDETRKKTPEVPIIKTAATVVAASTTTASSTLLTPTTTAKSPTDAASNATANTPTTATHPSTETTHNTVTPIATATNPATETTHNTVTPTATATNPATETTHNTVTPTDTPTTPNTSASTTASTPSTISTPASTVTAPTTPETTSSHCTSTPDLTTTSPPDGIPEFVLVENGTVCIILKANLQLYVTYFSDKSSLTKILIVNQDVNVSGSCRSEEERITFKWLAGQLPDEFSLTMKLVQLPKSPSKLGGSVVRGVHFEYFLSSDVFPSTNTTGHKNASVEGSFFETPAAMGFTCSAQQNITMGNVVLGVSHLHLEAFRNSSSRHFNEKAMDCTDIPASNQVVPIIVGLTAAILILLALSAFFIVNRRRAQGYQVL